MMPIETKRGFTLIELAVVIVIIGLIIGAVIKGQQLVADSRLTAVINQVNAIRSSISSFQEKYGALPGDFAQARNRLPGCEDAGADCTNGNGDGTIGTMSNITTGTISEESRMGWQHLAFANLVTGVVPGAAAGENVFGQNFPGARTGGGFVLVSQSIGTPAMSGLWLRLQGAFTASAVQNVTSGNGALTPGQAAEIDRKLDDGKPLTGYIRGDGVTENCAPSSGEYNEKVSSRDCLLYFFMGQ